MAALKIRQEKSKAKLEHDIEKFTDNLNALTNGDASRGIIAAPDQARCTAAMRAMLMPWPFHNFPIFPPNIVLDGCQTVIDCQDVAAALQATQMLWTSLSSMMAQNVETFMTTDIVDRTVIGEIEEGSTLLRSPLKR